jgi:hypothetical protein
MSWTSLLAVFLLSLVWTIKWNQSQAQRRNPSKGRDTEQPPNTPRRKTGLARLIEIAGAEKLLRQNQKDETQFSDPRDGIAGKDGQGGFCRRENIGQNMLDKHPERKSGE